MQVTQIQNNIITRQKKIKKLKISVVVQILGVAHYRGCLRASQPYSNIKGKEKNYLHNISDPTNQPNIQK